MNTLYNEGDYVRVEKREEAQDVIDSIERRTDDIVATIYQENNSVLGKKIIRKFQNAPGKFFTLEDIGKAYKKEQGGKK